MDPLCSVGGVGLAGEGCFWHGGEGIGVTRATAILLIGSKSTDFFVMRTSFRRMLFLEWPVLALGTVSIYVLSSLVQLLTKVLCF